MRGNRLNTEEWLTWEEKTYWALVVPWNLVLNKVYFTYLFCKIPHLSNDISGLVLVVLIGVCIIFGVRKVQTQSFYWKSFAACMLAPYLIYTAISCADSYMIPLLIIFGITVFCVFMRPIRKIERKMYVFLAGVLFMVVVICGTVISNISVKAETEAVDVYREDRGREFLLRNQLGTLQKFEQSDWEQLSTREKADVCQTLVNCLVQHFGITHEIPLQIQKIDGNICGFYDNEKDIIVLNSLHIDSGQKTCHTVVHEVFHGYTKELVRVYEQASPEDKNLMLFYEPGVYAKEFQEYHSASDNDLEQYYGQVCEIDAELYAMTITQQIFEMLENN